MGDQDLKIYFCGSIQGGRRDAELYTRIIKQLKQYGQVLTEVIGNKDVLSIEAGEGLIQKTVNTIWVNSVWSSLCAYVNLIVYFFVKKREICVKINRVVFNRPSWKYQISNNTTPLFKLKISGQKTRDFIALIMHFLQ